MDVHRRAEFQGLGVSLLHRGLARQTLPRMLTQDRPAGICLCLAAFCLSISDSVVTEHILIPR